MSKEDFNQEWICYETDCPEKYFKVNLPHDALLLDPRSGSSASGANLGWYHAQDYTYEKTFDIPVRYKNQKILFEFEGVYHKATVYINEIKAGYHSYGYTGFYVDATELLDYGKKIEFR